MDLCWPARRLIVEADRHDAHATAIAFEGDRRRDQRLVAAGWRVARFTWRQVVREPQLVVATLAELSGPTGP